MPVFGTPLTPHATRIMLLGSGELAKEIAIAAQRLGVEVVAVDHYANAPAHQVAHRAHVIDMSDAAAVRAVVEQERPALVVPEIGAIVTEALLAIEAERLAQVIPTAHAAHVAMNRERMRKLAGEELGLPTSPYAFASSLAELEEAAERIGYPCFIKPVMSSAGKGQSRAESAAELAGAWDNAARGGRVNAGGVIIESVLDFQYEITLLTVRALDDDGHIETHFCDPIGHLRLHGDYVECWQPHPMSEKALAKATDIAAKLTGALGGLGIFGVELFVAGDDVWFSEVNPRPHHTGMVTMVTQAQNEFELHVRAILGLPVGTRMRRPGASAAIYGGMEAEGIGFDGVADALRVPESQVRLFGKPAASPRRRMGVALANGNNIDIARKRAKECAARVKPVRLGQA